MMEEYLEGDEVSILAFSDGYSVVALPPAQDHKRIFDGDQGPNTGGMGCYAPTKVASEQVLKEIHRDILQPTIDGMRREGGPLPEHFWIAVPRLNLVRRISLCGNALHWAHDDNERTKSPRVQRALRRSRNTDSSSPS